MAGPLGSRAAETWVARAVTKPGRDLAKKNDGEGETHPPAEQHNAYGGSMLPLLVRIFDY